MTLPPSMFGVPALRSEDPRFLRGEGRYLENIPIPDALRAVFVRSIISHGRITGMEGLERARSMPGVAAVFTAADLRISPQAPSGNVEGASGTLEGPFARDVLARDVVRYVGEPVAVVVADSLARGEDAAELVWPVVDALDAVTDVEAAAADGAPVLFPAHGSNVAHAFEQHWDTDALAGADVIVSARIVQQRVAPVPMETNAIAVVPEDDGGYTIWCSTQVPFDVRSDLADLLEVDKERVRIVAPDVGGGFGAKLIVYPEFAVVAAVAKALGRPVRWAETRSESMLNLNHGRAQVQHVEIGAKRDGTVVGMRVELLGDMGAYPVGAFLPTTTQEMLAGVYAIPRIASRGWSVVTNGTPIAAYRGAGRPEATALVERAMDLIAAELGMDPVDVRRKNLIPADAFPYTTATGTTYDTGDYERALDEALRIAGVSELRAEQAARRERGDHLLLGIGVCTYVEITAFASKEFGSVQVHADGTVTVLTGVSPQGQGHETAMAQIASAILGVPFETVRVVHSDSAVVPRGAGTWGSRSLQVGGSAVVEQSQAVAAKARTLASHLLEVDEADLTEPLDGRFEVAGAPERAITWAELAATADDPSRLPEGMAPGLAASGQFRELESTFPFGAHVAVVEVDIQTGDVRLVRHIAVDDCGRILNPMLVDGQVHGGLGQGIAQALYEEFSYDEAGNPVSGNLATYSMPAASELPSFEIAHTETPTPLNPLGAKGIGESATIGSTPAVQSAVMDALSHLGVRHIDLPLAPERVWRAIRDATP
ncbi:MAG: xanthine dehydrogenase family protein molybdopterin-binding subunit [Actinomycetota bacterium]